MVGKATVITHGSNAVCYSADKEKAEIVKINHLPDNISSSAMWTRMMALQQKYKEKQNRHRPFKNTSIRIELSPAKEETEGWTMAAWEELADEYIREFDAIDLSEKAKRESARHTNLQNSQYVVSLHHDSKGQILHLHVNANRIDMEGNVNDAHFIHDRAMMAAKKSRNAEDGCRQRPSGNGTSARQQTTVSASSEAWTTSTGTSMRQGSRTKDMVSC